MSSVSFSEYSVEAVFKHLDLREDQIEEREAVRFVYKQYAHGEFKSDNPQLAVTDTIERVTQRFDMLNHYAENFFPENNHEWDALLIAIICDDMIEEASNLKEADDIGAIQDFSDDYAVKMADRFFDDATDLANRGLLKDEVVSPEALFLAHINTILDMHIKIDNIDQYNEDELYEIKEETQHARSFMRPETDIGYELLGAIDKLAKEVEARLPHICSLKVSFNGEAKYISFGSRDNDAEAITRLQKFLPYKDNVLRDLVKAYWYASNELYDEDIFEQASALFAQRTSLFAFFEGDLNLNTRERETALCSWLLTNFIDPQNNNYAHLMTDGTIAILDTISTKEHIQPTLSQWMEDKALLVPIGLNIFTHLNHIAYGYRDGNRGKTLSVDAQRADYDYAQTLLNEAPPFDCKLAYEIKEKAKVVMHSIKLPGPRPDLHLV